MSPIRCEDLTKSYGGIRAVDGVSLAFPNRAATALIGANGAGKTTLVDLLTGFRKVDTGRIFVGDTETTGWKPHRVARLGVVRTFQQMRVVRQVSVLENVLVAQPGAKGDGLLSPLLGLHRARREAELLERARVLLSAVDLADAAGKLAGELSYGHQKLLTIAMSMATDSSVLMLDEPVAGVHPDLAAVIVSLLQRLVQDGRSVVFIEHDLDSVRELADYVVLMDCGQIILAGSPDEVFAQAEVLEAYLG